jgi:hypothetical protein
MLISPQEQVQETEPTSGIFGMRKLIRKVKPNAGRRGATGTVNVLHPRIWSKDPVDISGATNAHHTLCIDYQGSSAMIDQVRLIELSIAGQLRKDYVESSVAALRVDTVVCTLPDVMLYPEAWPATSETLADSPLLQHAKVLPHSFAVMQYFLDTSAWVPPPLSASHVLVLSCDDSLVECTRHILQPISSGHFEVKEFDMLYMAELAG